MELEKEDYIAIAILGNIPLLGAVSAIVLDKVVTKYGHSFMQVGPKSTILIGVIGAAQSVAAAAFLFLTSEYTDSPIVALSASSIIAAGAIVGLTALAAKVNLISARLSLFAAGALIITSTIQNFIVLGAFILLLED